MARVLSVARLTLFLQLRRGAGLLLLSLAALVAIFIFAVSQADEVLLHELQLRSRYALHFSTAVFGIGLLWMSCMSMRGDIEAKRLHLLTSYPLKRWQIYVGKWLGCTIFGVLGAVTLLVVVGLCCQLYIWSWDDSDAKEALAAAEWRVEAVATPLRPDLDAMAEQRIETLQAEGRLPTPLEDPEGVRERLRLQVQYDLHLMAPGGEKRFEFAIDPGVRRGEGVTIVYRYLSSSRQEDVPLTWRVDAPLARLPFEQTHESFSLADNELHIPWESLPEDGRFALEVSGVDNPELVFYRAEGMRLLYQSSHLFTNAAKFVVAMSGHYMAIVAVGLTIGVAFTASVASFVGVVLYLLALASGFFQGFLNDLARGGEATAIDQLGQLVIRIGTFFTTGLEPPAVILPLSQAMEIGFGNLGMEMTRWFGGILAAPLRVVIGGPLDGLQLALGFCFYLLLAVLLGVVLVTRKELDRVH